MFMRSYMTGVIRTLLNLFRPKVDIERNYYHCNGHIECAHILQSDCTSMSDRNIPKAHDIYIDVNLKENLYFKNKTLYFG